MRHYCLQETGTGLPARGTYNICKGGVCYILQISHIRLMACDTGVALLAIALENLGEKTVNGITDEAGSRNLDDVNAINEYGRRIAFPYLPDPSGSGLTADKIEICIGGCTYSEDFIATLDALKDPCHPIAKEGLSTHYIMGPIRDLLSSGECLTTDSKEARKSLKKLFVEHVADDRMFVCCMVADDALSARLHETGPDGSYTALNDEDIYKLAFIETSCSCHSDTMRREILTRCAYDRWIGYSWPDPDSAPHYSGTLDLVTHHSLVRLTSPGADHVINAFQNQYVTMAKLALIQRATLIALEGECAVGKVRQIYRLQKRYIMVQKHFMLDECTVQEQGIEEFRMLRRELFVQERADSLEKRLQGLYELANLGHSRRSEILSGIITAIGLFLTLMELLG